MMPCRMTMGNFWIQKSRLKKYLTASKLTSNKLILILRWQAQSCRASFAKTKLGSSLQSPRSLRMRKGWRTWQKYIISSKSLACKRLRATNFSFFSQVIGPQLEAFYRTVLHWELGGQFLGQLHGSDGNWEQVQRIDGVDDSTFLDPKNVDECQKASEGCRWDRAKILYYFECRFISAYAPYKFAF